MIIQRYILPYRLATIIAFALLLCTGDLFADNFKRKGRFLQTEVEKYEDATSFDVTLAISKETSFPVFKIHKLNVRTIHEVKIFETVIDTINTKQSEGNLRDYRNLKVVPNEFIKDDRSTRQETVYVGAMANTPFTIDGIPVLTDANGLIVDTKQFWLDKFDDLSLNSITVTVEHAAYGKRSVLLTRLILRQPEKIMPEYRKKDSKSTLDILEGMGLDFTLLPNTTLNPVTFKCTLPDKCLFGDAFTITVEAHNTTGKASGNLFLCTFSRDKWLDGKLFYIGNLLPGQKRTFTRLIMVPNDIKTDAAHLVISSWDTNKAHPETAQEFTIAIGHR
ncbi:MAG: hypothetical protein J6X55_14830 [Victivallales bacterium]|nr:hypothetical protein [Victivallales bacterium]